MNGFHAIGRLAVLVTGLAAVLSSLCGCAVFVASARVPVPPGGHPHRHPSLPGPARAHAALAGTIPGWQLTLMAVTIVLLAATVVAIVYPGPRGSG
jgi:hypothetical protein